jgi:hypothetical protein
MSEVTPESLSAELRRKLFSFANGSGDLVLACSALDHPGNGMSVELHSHQLRKKS